MNINLRTFEQKDLDNYYHLNHPSRAYHQLNGPYFEKLDQAGLHKRIDDYRACFDRGDQPLPQSRMIVDEADQILGQVSWYWKSEETNWMEIGIVIYDEDNWGCGIGKKAMTAWIDDLFKERADLQRLGLTTWSGNQGMMALAKKLGMVCEARYRKARIVKGIYYDSVSYGVLREEWLT